MSRQYKTSLSQLYCPKSGNTFPIRRKYGQQRNKGHLKKIWCPYCGYEHNCIEIREKDYILENVL